MVLVCNKNMTRPIKKRWITFNPEVDYFKPRGIPLSSLKEVILTMDEMESLRLKYEENLEQIKAAKKMKISQSTFQRILNSAFKKISEALIKGKAIRIEGGNFEIIKTIERKFKCEDCKHLWKVPFGTGKRGVEMICPKCKSTNIHRNDNQGHGFGRQPWGFKNNK